MADANTGYDLKVAPVGNDEVIGLDSQDLINGKKKTKRMLVSAMQDAGRVTAPAALTINTAYQDLLVTGYGDVYVVKIGDATGNACSFILGTGIQQGVNYYAVVSPLANCGSVANPSANFVTLSPAGFTGNISIRVLNGYISIARTTGTNYVATIVIRKLN